MKMKTRVLIGLFFSLVLSTSCKSQYQLMLEGHDVPGKYKMAFELFDAKKYLKAAALFDDLKIAVRGTPQDDTVQFYAAYCQYKYGDVYAADQGFISFINAHPASPFTMRAHFMYVDCLYRQTYRYELDQTPTYKAINAINEFNTYYPNNEWKLQCEKMLSDLNGRLDRKSFEAAKLYYTIEDYKAAAYALRQALKEDNTNIYREEILYYLALSSYKYAYNSIPQKARERYVIFTDDYFSFITEYPDSKHRKELDALATKVQKILDKKE